MMCQDLENKKTYQLRNVDTADHLLTLQESQSIVIHNGKSEIPKQADGRDKS